MRYDIAKRELERIKNKHNNNMEKVRSEVISYKCITYVDAVQVLASDLYTLDEAIDDAYRMKVKRMDMLLLASIILKKDMLAMIG